ncbi:MAG: Fe-S cluster assembly protein SufD [Candidatus Nanopelagicales bacterium]|nr:Fe-S cluster assembly protein SufD [Candidatus Nanopelagicales bacterium]
MMAAAMPVLATADPGAFGEPTGHEEAWRFSPLRRMGGLHAEPTENVGVGYSAKAPGSAEFSVVERGDERLREMAAPTDRISANIARLFETAAVVRIPDGARLDEPVVLDSVGGSGGTSFGQVLVAVGAGARARVVVRHTGSGAYAGDITVRLAEGAQATVTTVQDMAPKGVFAGRVRAILGRDTQLRGVAVSIGGDLVRHSTEVSFDGPGGDAELLGAFFTSAGQHQEHRLFIDHGEPDCRSDVAYKGALAGDKAHSVWVGDVLIRPGARGTRAYELNRNLILTRGARADSVPNLEIETGQILGAGHASATGRFDDEQLFYLRSRGIPPAEARRLVVRGFLGGIIRRIEVDSVVSALSDAIDKRLSVLDGMGESP